MNAPITAIEEQAFYGLEISQEDWRAAIKRATIGFDADDLQTAAAECAAPILVALANGDYMTVGRILSESRHNTIKRRAEFECFGRITTPVYEAARFQKTFCSQCGGEFGPGDHGFSHCANHQEIDEERWIAADLANSRNKVEQHDAAAFQDQLKRKHAESFV